MAAMASSPAETETLFEILQVVDKFTHVAMRRVPDSRHCRDATPDRAKLLLV